MREVIRHRARELGFDACHFTTASPPATAPYYQNWLSQQRHGEMGYMSRNAHKRVDPHQVLPGAKSIITLAASYGEDPSRESAARRLKTENRSQDSDTISNIRHPPSTIHHPAAGIIARYAQYEDYHNVIGGRLRSLTQFITEQAGSAVRSLWYVDTGPILERDLAQRAGLGFIGKHTNLISREFGNWIFLAQILTTIELEADEPERNRCGSCVRCLAACPTGAITGPFQLDARRCISYLTIELKGAIPVELRPAIGNRIYGCDDCLAACPWNRFARQGALMRPHSRPDLAQPALLELLSLDENGFKRRFAGTPLLRARRKGFVRNVCVALGNSADASALPALERAASDPEQLVAEHARWAIDQIQNRYTLQKNAGGNPA